MPAPYRFAPYEHPGSLVPKLVFEAIGPFKSLLDVGGGTGTVGNDAWLNAGVSIAVLDIFPMTHTPHPFTNGNVLDAIKIYGEKSFDVVIACEIVEHLEKKDALRALDIICKLSRKLALVTMPNGFSVQDPEHDDAQGEEWKHNPWQKHLSGFTHEEMIKLGWSVYLNAGTAEMPWGSQVISMKAVR